MSKYAASVRLGLRGFPKHGYGRSYRVGRVLWSTMTTNRRLVLDGRPDVGRAMVSHAPVPSLAVHDCFGETTNLADDDYARKMGWDFAQSVNHANRFAILRVDSAPHRCATDYFRFRQIETGSHVPGHTWIGKDMATVRAPIDPLFYLHHCNVDGLWAMCQSVRS